MPSITVRDKTTPGLAVVKKLFSRLDSLAARVEEMPKAAFVKGSATADRDRLQLLEHARQLNARIRRIEERLGETVTAPHARTLQALVKKSALLPSVQFAARMSFSKQALSKALTAHRLFYLEVTGTRYFPAFFADHRYERRQLERVSRALGELPGSAKWQFFVRPKGSLGGLAPLDALAKGQYSAVRNAAESFAQR